MQRVEQVGITTKVDPNHAGWYAVSVWVTTENHGVRQALYFDRLSWVEAVDVVLAIFDENKPGTTVGEGFTQDVLW